MKTPTAPTSIAEQSVPRLESQPEVFDRPSSVEADWSRETCGLFTWAPGRQVLKGIRGYQGSLGRGPVAWLARKWWTLHHRFWTVVAGCDIPVNCRIGGGLLMPHPNGVVLHPESRVGPNCLLFQQVTLGSGPRPGLPTLAGHVDVGAGAKLLGGIHVGAHAVIGANAVVVCDVPPGATMVGIPARPIDRMRDSEVRAHTGQLP